MRQFGRKMFFKLYFIYSREELRLLKTLNFQNNIKYKIFLKTALFKKLIIKDWQEYKNCVRRNRNSQRISLCILSRALFIFVDLIRSVVCGGFNFWNIIKTIKEKFIERFCIPRCHLPCWRWGGKCWEWSQKLEDRSGGTASAAGET